MQAIQSELVQFGNSLHCEVKELRVTNSYGRQVSQWLLKVFSGGVFSLESS